VGAAVVAALLVAIVAIHPGVYRWAVKTAADGFQWTAPRPATIAELGALKPPAVTSTLKRTLRERVTYRVSGTVAKVKLEADGDLHIVLAGGGGTMICEVPDPRYIGKPFGRWDVVARQTAKSLTPGDHVTITGPLFFDKLHDAKGAAPNGAELHPALQIERTR
jgi:hypothetical protein